MNKSIQNVGRRIKPTGYIYLPGSQLCEAEGHLNIGSCLYDYIINSAYRIVNTINKYELYSQFPSRRLKYTNVNEI